VFALGLTAMWRAWVALLATPLPRRSAWRLTHLIAGILRASGRRTVSRWFRAAGIGPAFRSHYYVLDALGRKATEGATLRWGLVLFRVQPAERLPRALDDTPTKRYGPKIQGAGIHHNPTPGPAGSPFLHGHSWVVLNRVVAHPQGGAIGLPLLGRLYIRKTDLPKWPDTVDWEFQTKPELAAEVITWAGTVVAGREQRPWVVVDGTYCNREFRKPAQRAGFTVVARLRRNADLYDLPPKRKPGEPRGPGRPPTHGQNSISLAKRAGHQQGWQTVRVRTTAGHVVTKTVKSFLATWHPAGGQVRIVILKEADGQWRASLCTDPEASVEAIVQAILDRWAIEQNFTDLKEVEGIEEVQVRRVWSNVGALNLNLWVHTRVEPWAWDRSAEEVRDRSDRPWDDAERRPSQAERRKALQREMIQKEFRQCWGRRPLPEKIRRMLDYVVRLVA
jgi:Transposase DDE domain